VSEVPVIRVQDVHKAFGPQKVLDGLNFEVAKGESLVIMGPSGSGKSVILKHLIGLLRPDAGLIEVAGREVPRLRPSGLAELRRDMGYLFQHAALINWLSVYDNIALPLRETTSKSETEIESKVTSVLELGSLRLASSAAASGPSTTGMIGEEAARPVRRSNCATRSQSRSRMEAST